MTLLARNMLPVVALLSALGVASCTTMRARSDFYSEADFSSYRSFAWVDESPLVRSASSRVEISPLSVRRVREAIERELAGKGFEQVVSRDGADFAVAFTVGARDNIVRNDYPVYYRSRGPWLWRAPYYAPYINVEIYTEVEGTLAIDIFDNATRQPVWHGWVSKRITGADLDDPLPAINAAVKAILRDFPPTE
jgi:hypothetical protein